MKSSTEDAEFRHGATVEPMRHAAFELKMRGTIAESLRLEAGQVSVKAKSTDGLGATGRGEGIAAIATALLRKG